MRCTISAVAAAMMLAGTVLGQGPSTPALPGPRSPESLKPVPVPFEPDVVWKLAVDAYRNHRVAERVSVSLKVDRQVRTSDFVVRFDPGRAEDRSQRVVLIELGVLRAYASKGVLTVWSTQNDGAYFQSEYTGEFTAESLEASLPPVPAPQLAAAADARPERPMTLASYLRDVRWMTGSLAEEPGAKLTMPGVSPNGTAQWLADPKSGRLVTFVASIKAPAVDMRLSCTGIDPGDPAAWKPDMSQRRRVAAVSELGHKGEPTKRTEPKPGEPKPADGSPNGTKPADGVPASAKPPEPKPAETPAKP